MKKILLTCFMLVFVLHAWAQDRTVSGTVTDDETGESLPGVNVLLKGTGTGITTDLDGNYKISVPSEGGTLVFTFIGMVKQEVAIGARSVIDIQMATDVQQLSEVVVTGYGSQLKREITGSISSVKGDVIEDLPMQSFDRAIQGRVAGTQISAASGAPGGAMNIRIRGVGSINSSNDPLIIIDGVQVGTQGGGSTQGSSNPLNSINPNDIESIDILKDASASAIYGAQAANGVVIVTTKTGSRKGKTQVNLSVQEGVVQPFNLYEVLGAEDFTRFQAQQQINVGIDPATPGTGAFALYGNPEDPSSYEEYDWVDNMFQDARFRTYDLSMSGGDEKTQFYFGGSYNKQEGQVIMSDFERFTGRLNLNHQATDKLTVGAKLSLAHNRQFGSIANGNFVNGPWVASFEAIPTSPATDANGDYNLYPTNGLSHLFGYNILQGVNEEVRLGRTLQTVSSANATYQILPSLSATGFVGIDFSMNRDDNQRPSTIPVFRAAGGSIFVNNRRTINFNTNYNLNYSKIFADVHRVKAIVGYEYKFEEREGASLGANSFANPFFRLPGDGQPTSVGGFFQEYKRLGVFGKVDYDYDDRYLASVTVRRDGHSRFGSESKYGTFYAGSLGWRLSDEVFLQDVSFVDDLKLKASYGVLGNAELRSPIDGTPANYVPLTNWGGATGQYLGGSTVTVTQLGNDFVSWEEEEAINIGIDYSLLNNRLFGNIDFWRTNNRDLLFAVPFFQNAGVTNNSIFDNVGALRNQGIDIEIGGIVVDQGGFRFDSRFNISFLQNEVTELTGGQDTIFDADTGIPELIVGEPADFFYFAESAGVNPANGRQMFINKDGNLSYTENFEDGYVAGSAIPTHFGGWSNTFSYKGLSLDVFFQYQYGNMAYNGDLYNLLGPGGVGNKRQDILNSWEQPGDLTNYPQVTPNQTIAGVAQTSNNLVTDRFLSDASYIRLKTLTLSYDIPKSILERANMRQARVFVQGVNLLTWTEYDGIDPEVVANNNGTGVSSFGAYPLGRQFSAGINIGL
ncbi:TonB-linked outer membrane protein, SusC/RagA family [Marivirga sericea]|uniref:TonB-linked outer membrane protein, SusC/RagA family n=1 Tax=Marivirga sericea TaxID=1028 RepID=A0A1X7JC88_9BACT|nr:TonB-dependent receptor [Marivirga sericea]SMG25527.1 TonB-linked outer membrane protein, SusC/RagA family [Marivirga sericea]